MSSTFEVKITTKDTVAAFSAEDMERIFSYIDSEDYQALEKMIVSGRAFHLPKDYKVQVIVSQQDGIPACKLRLFGSLTEVWASISAIS